MGRIIQIDRLKAFNPAEFIGYPGFSIWRGSINGDGLSGEEEQDQRSLVLTEIDLARIRLVTCLRREENCINGERNLERLKLSGYIRLDAKVFQALWEESQREESRRKEGQPFLLECFKQKTKGYTTFIYCDGTILRGPGSRPYPYSLRFYYDDHGGLWHQNCDLLYEWRCINNVSMVLADS